MKTNVLRLSILLFFLPLFINSPVFCQTPADINEAHALFKHGRYSDARKKYRTFLNKSNMDNKEITLPYFKTFLALGEYAEGLNEAEKLLEENPQNPVLLNVKGKFLTETGKYDEAKSIFEQVKSLDPNFAENISDFAKVCAVTGQKPKAKELYSEIYDLYLRGVFTSSEDLSLAGLAASYLEQFHEANRAYRTAYQKDPENTENLNRWALLFYEKYNNADAKRTFEEAVEINPHNADIFAGYARSFESFAAMEEYAKKALAENPNHVESMNILAELHILDSRYDEAESVLEQALKINPSSMISLANLASIYHLKEQNSEFEKTERLALQINPVCGDFYIKISDNCSKRFRYRDALGFSRKAVKIEPGNWNAHSSLGINLLRLGDVENAKTHLNKTFEKDPFNLFAKNSLDLIDGYADFDILESQNFSLKIHKSESIITGNSVLEIAEEAYDSLSSRYDYIPQGKILIEAYYDHADLAVRIGGLPNIDIVGVSFGDIVAFDTPRAQPEHEYNWAQTLWHELAHVMTIGLSDHRVPRWLTEGLSVYEEKRARPEWARKMDIELYLALKQNRLLPLDKLNSGFTRPDFPGRILLAYYQSMKVVEFLIETYGFQVIPQLLTGFKNFNSLEENFSSILNKTTKEINSEFFSYLKTKMQDMDNVTEGLDNIFENQGKKSLMDKIFTKSNPYLTAYENGVKYLNDKNYAEAEKMFLKAIEIYPYFLDGDNAYIKLAEIYRTTQKKDKLENILLKYMNVTEYGAEQARELAGLYKDKNEYKKAEHFFNRSLYTEPYNPGSHLSLAEIYRTQELYTEEIEQRRILLALNPVDKAEAFYNLGLSLYNNDNVTGAKIEVLKALEIAPGFKKAQKLLLSCIKNQN